MTNHKALIIGLDGGTWSVLQPLIDAGYLRHIPALVKRGVSGVLRSTVPPITPVAWASFQTGVNPGKHGVMGFENFDRDTKQLDLVTSDSLRVKTLWELVSDAGRRVIVINVPLTFPPHPVNGLLVSGMFTPSVRSNYTYPRQLAQEIKTVIPSYSILKDHEFASDFTGDYTPFLGALANGVGQRAQLAMYLRDRYEWDLLMVHFQEPDVLQHRLWPHLDREHPDHDPQAFAQIGRFYAYLDSMVGLLLEGRRGELFTFLVSDHGFQRHWATINLNEWLGQRGYLRLHHAGPRGLPRRLMLLARHLDRLGLRNRLLHRSTKEALLNAVQQNAMVDWSRTSAFSIGRETYGLIYLTVEEEEREYHRTLLEHDLLSLRDHLTGEQIVVGCRSGKEVYTGAAEDSFIPDLVVIPRPGYTFGTTIGGGKVFQAVTAASRHAGTHHEAGIFVIDGPGLGVAEPALRASIMDVAPTVLALMGIPIPTYMDGQVLNCCRLPGDTSPQYYEEQPREQVAGSAVASQGDEDMVRERLRGLGYLD